MKRVVMLRLTSSNRNFNSCLLSGVNLPSKVNSDWRWLTSFLLFPSKSLTKGSPQPNQKWWALLEEDNAIPYLMVLDIRICTFFEKNC